MKYSYTILFALVAISCSAQYDKKDKKKFSGDSYFTQNSIRLSLVVPAVEAEFKVSEDATIIVGTQMAVYPLSTKITDNNGVSKSTREYIPLIVPNVAFRDYYNLKKRYDQGKKTEGNSANYMGLGFSYIPKAHKELGGIDFQYSGPALMGFWGMNRVYGKHLLVDLGLGAMFMINTVGADSGFKPIPLLNVKVGYNLNY